MMTFCARTCLLVQQSRLRINESLWRVKHWLDAKGLEMALEKIEALLVTARRSFNPPRIVLGGLKVQWSRNLKYLGMQLDRRLSFGEHLKLLYAAPVWTSATNNHTILKKLFSGQRGVVLRIISAYRTMSTSAVLVLASVPPIDFLARERQEAFQLRKELSCNDNE